MGGRLTINGEAVGLDAYRSAFGFVPQEDTMLRMLTVAETCNFYASMRLPPEVGRAEQAAVAEAVIQILGMEHIRHSKIGDAETRGISGGQRKRVSTGAPQTGGSRVFLTPCASAYFLPYYSDRGIWR